MDVAFNPSGTKIVAALDNDGYNSPWMVVVLRIDGTYLGYYRDETF